MRLVRSGTGRLLAVAIMVTTAMTSCTQSSSSPGRTDGATSSIAPAPSRTETASSGVSSTSSGVSSTAASRESSSSGAVLVRRCTYGTVHDLTRTSNDVTAGPVVYPNAKLVGSPAGLSDFYGGGQVPDGPEGSRFYKMGTLVKAGAMVTITVAPSARPYLRLHQGPGPGPNLQGEMSVVFQACPGRSYTGWVGGFDIKGPMPACVALDVQVSGEQTPRRLTIPFGGPACGSS